MKVFPFIAVLLSVSAMADEPPSRAVVASEAFTSIDAIGAVVPASIKLNFGDEWSVVGVDKANDVMVANAQNHSAVLHVKVQVFEAYKEDGWSYRLMAPDSTVTINGTKIFCRTWAYFRADQADALVDVHTGSELILSGTLGRADMRMNDGQPGLFLDLHDARVIKPGPFTSIDAIGAAVPPWVKLNLGDEWSVVGVDKANDAIVANAQNRPATLPLKVQVFEAYKEDGWTYRLMAPDSAVTINGTKIFCRIWAYFRADQAGALADVRTGSNLVLSGILGRADVRMYDGRPGLCLDLHDATVEKDTPPDQELR
jgi:hypothetical protein